MTGSNHVHDQAHAARGLRLLATRLAGCAAARGLSIVPSVGKNFDSPAGSREAAVSRSAIRRLPRAEASSFSARIILPRYAMTNEVAIERSDLAVVAVTPAWVANASTTLDSRLPNKRDW